MDRAAQGDFTSLLSNLKKLFYFLLFWSIHGPPSSIQVPLNQVRAVRSILFIIIDCKAEPNILIES